MVTMFGWLSAEADARFLDEAAVSLGVRRRLRRQHLDRDRPAEPGVDGAIDDAHPAAADLPSMR